MKKYTNRVLATIIALFILVAIFLGLFSKPFMTYSTSFISTNFSTNISSKISSSQDFKNFDRIVISGPWKVQISQGKFNLADSQELSPQAAYVSDGVLYLRSNPLNQIINIQLPKLTSLAISGAARVSLDDFNSQYQTDDIQLETPLKLELSGAVKLKVTNSKFKNIILNASGATDVDFEQSLLEQLHLQLSGVSNLQLNSLVNGHLNGRVSGTSKIKYSGTLLSNDLQTAGQVEIRH